MKCERGAAQRPYCIHFSWSISSMAAINIGAVVLPRLPRSKPELLLLLLLLLIPIDTHSQQISIMAAHVAIVILYVRRFNSSASAVSVR